MAVAQDPSPLAKLDTKLQHPQTKTKIVQVSQPQPAPCRAHTAQVKSLMTSVPPETELVVTIQRATNLPSRASVESVVATRGRSECTRTCSLVVVSWLL